ncbi:MAG TPA: asparagine synthetase B, partial [Bacteroidia bacterium]|nr:asparagine synthetase B [Bacteroidia bacterium]
MKRKIFSIFFILFAFVQARASFIFIPMDESQTNCLKAYGIAYMALKNGIGVEWLLNYRGGSFSFPDATLFEVECKIRNVKFEIIADEQESAILAQIADPSVNMDAVKLEKPPKIAVYSPKNKM